MPTATSTITAMVYSPQPHGKGTVKSVLPIAVPTASSTSTTLRSLYSRAARAFLHRDIVLTHSLVESAFQLLKPPLLVHDPLNDQRRKWDILRITLETTVFVDPPPIDSIPSILRSNLTESPQNLMSNIYRRSLELFTPTSSSSEKATPNATHLPSAVLITLLYSSLKVDSPDIGRMVAEQWMSRRETPLLLNSEDSAEEAEEDGYDKVVEIYCLHILPKLEQWEYAKEFLQFEGDLQDSRREFFKSRLATLHVEALASRKPQPLRPSPSATPTPRSHSPAPSSSSSSSLSTTSTHTVVPATPRGNRLAAGPSKLNASTSASVSSKTSSDGTATPRGRKVGLPNGHSRPSSQTRNSSITSSSSASDPRATLPTTSISTSPPTVLSLIKASLAPHLTTSKITTFVILFVLFPLISWVLRMRHRRRRISTAAGLTPSNVDLVRRRLQVAGASDANLVTRLWKGSLQVVLDTVKMAGSGLV